EVGDPAAVGVIPIVAILQIAITEADVRHPHRPRRLADHRPNAQLAVEETIAAGVRERSPVLQLSVVGMASGEKVELGNGLPAVARGVFIVRAADAEERAGVFHAGFAVLEGAERAADLAGLRDQAGLDLQGLARLPDGDPGFLCPEPR